MREVRLGRGASPHRTPLADVGLAQVTAEAYEASPQCEELAARGVLTAAARPGEIALRGLHLKAAGELVPSADSSHFVSRIHDLSRPYASGLATKFFTPNRRALRIPVDASSPWRVGVARATGPVYARSLTASRPVAGARRSGSSTSRVGCSGSTTRPSPSASILRTGICSCTQARCSRRRSLTTSAQRSPRGCAASSPPPPRRPP